MSVLHFGKSRVWSEGNDEALSRPLAIKEGP